MDCLVDMIHRSPALIFYAKFLRDNFAGDVSRSAASADERLSVRYPRGELALKQTAANVYAAEFPIGTLQFTRSADGACTGFTLGDGRVRKLRFDKITIVPAANPPMPQVPRSSHL